MRKQRDGFGRKGRVVQMDDVLVQALNLACGLRIDTGSALPARPATVDEIVSAAGTFAAFLRGEIKTEESDSRARVPAVPIEDSIHDDYIVCLDDGVKLRMMRRHLTSLGYTPESYRTFWGLPGNYPMTAPAYSKERSALARNIGLGTGATTPRRQARGVGDRE
jgi:MucR family transcriptional regulator, transcriptional regulator of exopolysaccharide biosynthesis